VDLLTSCSSFAERCVTLGLHLHTSSSWWPHQSSEGSRFVLEEDAIAEPDGPLAIRPDDELVHAIHRELEDCAARHPVGLEVYLENEINAGGVDICVPTAAVEQHLRRLPPHVRLPETHTSDVDRTIVWEKIVVELANGWLEVSPDVLIAGRIFVGPKQRLLFWPKVVNDCISAEDARVTYGTVRQLLVECVKVGVKLDLKAAFRTVLVAITQRELLGVIVDSIQMRYRRLPFGLRSSPRLFCQLLDRTLRKLRTPLHASISPYVDDVAIADRDSRALLLRLRELIRLLRSDGWIVAYDKTFARPAAVLVFLGFRVSFSDRSFSIAPAKARKVLSWIEEVLPDADFSAHCSDTLTPSATPPPPEGYCGPWSPVPRRPLRADTRPFGADLEGQPLAPRQAVLLEQVLGMISWLSAAIPFMGILRRPVDIALAMGSWSAEALDAMDELHFTISHAPALRRSIAAPTSPLYVVTDASDSGWCAIVADATEAIRLATGRFSQTHALSSSTAREAVAGWNGILQASQSGRQFDSVVIVTDSRSLTSSINNERARAPRLCREMRALADAARAGLPITAWWTRRHLGWQPWADAGSGFDARFATDWWGPSPALRLLIEKAAGPWDVHVGAADVDTSLAPCYSTWELPNGIRGDTWHSAPRTLSGWIGLGLDVALNDRHVVIYPDWGDVTRTILRLRTATPRSLTIVSRRDQAAEEAMLRSFPHVFAHWIPPTRPDLHWTRLSDGRNARVPLAIYSSRPLRIRSTCLNPAVVRPVSARQNDAEQILAAAMDSKLHPGPTEDPPSSWLEILRRRRAEGGAPAATTSCVLTSAPPQPRAAPHAQATFVTAPSDLTQPATTPSHQPVPSSAHRQIAPCPLTTPAAFPDEARIAAHDLHPWAPFNPPTYRHPLHDPSHTLHPAYWTTGIPEPGVRAVQAPLVQTTHAEAPQSLHRPVGVPTACAPSARMSIKTWLIQVAAWHADSGPRHTTLPPTLRQAHERAMVPVRNMAAAGSDRHIKTVAYLATLAEALGCLDTTADAPTLSALGAAYIDHRLRTPPPFNWRKCEHADTPLDDLSAVAEAARRCGLTVEPYLGPEPLRAAMARGAKQKADNSAAYPIHLSRLMTLRPQDRSSREGRAWEALFIFSIFCLRTGISLTVWRRQFVPYAHGWLLIWATWSKGARGDAALPEKTTARIQVSAATHPILDEILAPMPDDAQLFPDVSYTDLSAFVRRYFTDAPAAFDVRSYGVRVAADQDAAALAIPKELCDAMFWWRRPEKEMRSYYAGVNVLRMLQFSEARTKIVHKAVMPGRYAATLQGPAPDWTTPIDASAWGELPDVERRLLDDASTFVPPQVPARVKERAARATQRAATTATALAVGDAPAHHYTSAGDPTATDDRWHDARLDEGVRDGSVPGIPCAGECGTLLGDTEGFLCDVADCPNLEFSVCGRCHPGGESAPLRCPLHRAPPAAAPRPRVEPSPEPRHSPQRVPATTTPLSRPSRRVRTTHSELLLQSRPATHAPSTAIETRKKRALEQEQENERRASILLRTRPPTRGHVVEVDSDAVG
jgi:hypothetical protein